MLFNVIITYSQQCQRSSIRFDFDGVSMTSFSIKFLRWCLPLSFIDGLVIVWVVHPQWLNKRHHEDTPTNWDPPLFRKTSLISGPNLYWYPHLFSAKPIGRFWQPTFGKCISIGRLPFEFSFADANPCKWHYKFWFVSCLRSYSEKICFLAYF